MMPVGRILWSMVSKTRNMSVASYPVERKDSDGADLSRKWRKLTPVAQHCSSDYPAHSPSYSPRSHSQHYT
jgi:hypothetical protein